MKTKNLIINVTNIEIKERLRLIISLMDIGLIEKDIEIRILLLAAICGEHVLFVGPPGTAKSELGRRLSKVFKGTFFERLLTRFTVPEELIGPLSIRAMEQDQYIRQIEGYLPDSKIAFIDEIFRANSAILNTLLTILNERMFDNGNHRHRIPLICLVGASNELPESEELDALYDRFLFRRKVKYVSEKGLSELISSTEFKNSEYEFVESSNIYSTKTTDKLGKLKLKIETSSLIDDADLSSIRFEALRRVNVTEQLVKLVSALRKYMQTEQEPPLYISDRRLVKMINMLKVAAYTNERTEICQFDCLLLRRCLEQEHLLDFLINKLSTNEEIPNFELIMRRIFARCCMVLTGAKEDKNLIMELASFSNEIISGMKQLYTNNETSSSTVIDNIWFGKDEELMLSSLMSTKIDKTRNQLENLALEIEMLKVIIDFRVNPTVCAELFGSRWVDFLKAPLLLQGED
jgi:MoxR-like ATPase